MADDPAVSDRLRRFLAGRSRRIGHMDERDVVVAAALEVGGHRTAAPDDLVAAMVRFEERYGGLVYAAIGGNDTDYGLDNDPTGRASIVGTVFGGITDGDWTWNVDVLVDGRTVMQPGAWPCRVIDRSVDQRLEKHALLASVHRWTHQTAICRTPSGAMPHIDDRRLPPPVAEATGPTDFWYADQDTAVEITLSAWPTHHDEWTVRVFGRIPDQLPNTRPAVDLVRGDDQIVPARWCDLCSRPLAPHEVCSPDR